MDTTNFKKKKKKKEQIIKPKLNFKSLKQLDLLKKKMQK